MEAPRRVSNPEAPFIDPEFARKAMEKAVASKGEDHVYEKVDATECVYSYKTATGHQRCIVGEAMVLAGVVEDEWFVPGVNSVGPGHMLRELQRDGLISGYTHSVEIALASAQQLQDQGTPWGEAFKYFEEDLEAQREKDS